MTDENTNTNLIALCPCESSQISHHGYDKSTCTLALKFKRGGSVYHYDGVSPEMYEELRQAKSIGKFFGQHIKAGGFKFRKITNKDYGEDAKTSEGNAG